MKTERRDLVIQTNFLAMILINFFCHYEKVFTHMNAWMIGKNSMKHHYLRKKFFYSHLVVENITDARTQKDLVKILKSKI